MRKIFYLLVLSIAFLNSCKKSEYNPTTNATINMNGEWWAELYESDDTTVIFAYEDFAHSFTTSNSSKNVNSELILDMSKLDNITSKSIVPINYSALTFNSNTTLLNLPDSTNTILLNEGKILKNAAHSPSNHVTDSIRIVFEFIDDPGVKYVLKGYKDTGWPEDRRDN
jgi:hypothetical protein